MYTFTYIQVVVHCVACGDDDMFATLIHQWYVRLNTSVEVRFVCGTLSYLVIHLLPYHGSSHIIAKHTSADRIVDITECRSSQSTVLTENSVRFNVRNREASGHRVSVC